MKIVEKNPLLWYTRLNPNQKTGEAEVSKSCFVPGPRNSRAAEMAVNYEDEKGESKKCQMSLNVKCNLKCLQMSNIIGSQRWQSIMKMKRGKVGGSDIWTTDKGVESTVDGQVSKGQRYGWIRCQTDKGMDGQVSKGQKYGWRGVKMTKVWMDKM